MSISIRSNPVAPHLDDHQPINTMNISSYGSGSYPPCDVTVLLDIVAKDAVADVPVTQKEALIQSGQRHYSDMLTLEQAPTAMHETLYEQALAEGAERMATDIANLAYSLQQLFQKQVTHDKPLILISLVRAGLPVGVLLQRALADDKQDYALPSRHYGMSIIRDRGLDTRALQLLLDTYPDSPMVFVDGWTGKGAIYQELARSLAPFSEPLQPHFNNIFHQGAGVIPLLTLADPAGVAWLSASGDDWLIPSGLLNSTVSGLISRSLYTEPQIGLHRSVFYDNLASADRSTAFITHIDEARQQIKAEPQQLTTHQTPRYHTAKLIDTLTRKYDISNRNRIKPTIAEATRAILRRDPEQVLLASSDHPDTALLRYLCAQRDIEVTVLGDTILPYQAITLIKQRSAES